MQRFCNYGMTYRICQCISWFICRKFSLTCDTSAGQTKLVIFKPPLYVDKSLKMIGLSLKYSCQIEKKMEKKELLRELKEKLADYDWKIRAIDDLVELAKGTVHFI